MTGDVTKFRTKPSEREESAWVPGCLKATLVLSFILTLIYEQFTTNQGRNEVCGIKDQRDGIRDQRVGSRIAALGTGSAVFDRDRAVPHLWDQGRKLVTLLQSRNKFVYKNGISDEKTSSLPP